MNNNNTSYAFAPIRLHDFLSVFIYCSLVLQLAISLLVYSSQIKRIICFFIFIKKQ